MVTLTLEKKCHSTSANLLKMFGIMCEDQKIKEPRITIVNSTEIQIECDDLRHVYDFGRAIGEWKFEF
jgi:hypothetical protein